jgi:G3E family GTPase
VASIFWLDEALNSRLRLDGIVACVDAKNIAFQLESTSSAASSRGTMTEGGEQGGGGDEAARQLAFADRIIVNKIDLLQHDNENDIKSVIRQIQNINPTAPIKTTTYSKIEELDWILEANCFDAERAKDVDSAFQLVIDDDAKGEIVPVGESAVGMQNENMCKIGCCIGNHPPNGVCGICGGTEPQLSSPSINLHRHTNAVGTVALFGCGSVDLHRVHCWLASILWPNQDVSDRILRAKLEASHLEHAETKGQNTEDDANSKSQLIYRVKGILSVRHAIDNMGKIIPASNDWVDDGIVAGVVDSIDGLDQRRFILQSVHDLWDVFPASENLHWETTETRCCKVIVIGKHLDRGELQDGFTACFHN